MDPVKKETDREAPGSKANITTYVILSVGMLCLGLLGGYFVGQRKARQAIEKMGKAQGEEQLAVPVETALCTTGDMVLSYFATGAIQSPKMVMVFPKLPGTVKEIHAQEGDLVKEGQLLVTLDEEEVRLTVEQAKANLESAESKYRTLVSPPREEHLEKAKAAVEQAREALAIAEKAYERGKGLREADMIPEMELDRYESEYKKALSAVDMAERDLQLLTEGPTDEERKGAWAQVEAMKKAMQMAELKLDYAHVTAPISGMIMSMEVVKGEMLVEKGKPILIADLRSLEVKVNIPEKQIQNIREEQEVLLEVDALPEEEFEGSVSAISPMVDLKSGTVTVDVKVDNPEMKLRPGMFCRLNIVLERHQSVLIIPKQSILYSRGQKQVFVVEDEKARLADVETGLEDESRVEVLSGLQAEDQIIVVGQNTIRDGAKVRIVRSSTSFDELEG